MIVHRRLERERRFPFDGALDAALPRMAVPDAVVEAELDFLLDIAGKVVRRDPDWCGCRKPPRGRLVCVDSCSWQLNPRSCRPRARPARAGRWPCTVFSRPAEREVDQLDVMDGDISARIAAPIHSANWPPEICLGSNSEQ